MKEIDARGLACPAPVLLAKEAIETEKADAVRILVDNPASRENVSIFLESRHFTVSVTETGGHFQVTGQGQGGSGRATPSETFASARQATAESKILVLVTSDRIGRGDDVLGAKLMVNFIHTLKEMGPELWRLVFLNSGVKLATAGSDVLPALMELEAAGVHILVCGTCLDHFQLLEQKAVGETTNMLDIITSLQLADKVVHM